MSTKIERPKVTRTSPGNYVARYGGRTFELSSYYASDDYGSGMRWTVVEQGERDAFLGEAFDTKREALSRIAAAVDSVPDAIASGWGCCEKA